MSQYAAFKIFISYRRDTGRDFAVHLREGLERERISAFLDIIDIPKKFKGKEEWAKFRDNAILESEIFLLIITDGIENSMEVLKEITLARGKDDMNFVYLRHQGLKPDIILDLKSEKLKLGNFNQIEFETKEDLLRKVLRSLEEENKKVSSHKLQIVKALPQQNEITNSLAKRTTSLKHHGKKLDAIDNFAAFFHNVLGSVRVERLYPRVFTVEELKGLDKAEKIRKILENYAEDRQMLKKVVQKIISLHVDHSKRNIDELRDILKDLGLNLKDDLTLEDMSNIIISS